MMQNMQKFSHSHTHAHIFISMDFLSFCIRNNWTKHTYATNCGCGCLLSLYISTWINKCKAIHVDYNLLSCYFMAFDEHLQRFRCERESRYVRHGKEWKGWMNAEKNHVLAFFDGMFTHCTFQKYIESIDYQRDRGKKLCVFFSSIFLLSCIAFCVL